MKVLQNPVRDAFLNITKGIVAAVAVRGLSHASEWGSRYVQSRLAVTVRITPGSQLYEDVMDWLMQECVDKARHFNATFEPQDPDVGAIRGALAEAVPSHMNDCASVNPHLTSGYLGRLAAIVPQPSFPTPKAPSYVRMRPDADVLTIRMGNRLLIVRREVNEPSLSLGENGAIQLPVMERNASPTYLFSLVGGNGQELRELLNNIVLERQKTRQQSGHTDIWVLGGQGWQKLTSKPPRMAGTVILQEGVLDHLMTDVKTFLASHAKYRNLGIPWRRGYLLEGLPGTGKTSAIHSVATTFALSLYIIPLASCAMSDHTLMYRMSEIPTHAAVVFEDFDASGIGTVSDSQVSNETMLDIRASKRAKEQYGPEPDRITLTGLLNVIDGLMAPEGRITFFTTNHVEKFEPRMFRAGRVDEHIKFGYATRNQIREMWTLYFPETEVRYTELFADSIMSQGQFVTAQVQQYLMTYLDDWEEAFENRCTFTDVTRNPTEEAPC